MIDREKLFVLIRDTVDLNLSSGVTANAIVDDIMKHYDLTLKPKPIEVGCKVRWNGNINEWTVVAVHENRAWLDAKHSYHIAPFNELKRID